MQRLLSHNKYECTVNLSTDVSRYHLLGLMAVDSDWATVAKLEHLTYLFADSVDFYPALYKSITESCIIV